MVPKSIEETELPERLTEMVGLPHTLALVPINNNNSTAHKYFIYVFTIALIDKIFVFIIFNF